MLGGRADQGRRDALAHHVGDDQIEDVGAVVVEVEEVAVHIARDGTDAAATSKGGNADGN